MFNQYAEIDWPGEGIGTTLFDLSGLYNILIFGILLIAGIIAFKYLPGKTFPLLVGGGLMLLGFAVLMGYIQVI